MPINTKEVDEARKILGDRRTSPQAAASVMSQLTEEERAALWRSTIKDIHGSLGLTVRVKPWWKFWG